MKVNSCYNTCAICVKNKLPKTVGAVRHKVNPPTEEKLVIYLIDIASFCFGRKGLFLYGFAFKFAPMRNAFMQKRIWVLCNCKKRYNKRPYDNIKGGVPNG